MSGRDESSVTRVPIFCPDSRISCKDAIPITTERMMMETGSSFVRPKKDGMLLANSLVFISELRKNIFFESLFTDSFSVFSSFGVLVWFCRLT